MIRTFFQGFFSGLFNYYLDFWKFSHFFPTNKNARTEQSSVVHDTYTDFSRTKQVLCMIKIYITVLNFKILIF
jgi:hypothetical protein